MNIVGRYASTGNVFESQSYQKDSEKELISTVILNDADLAGIEVTISEMTDDELQTAILA